MVIKILRSFCHLKFDSITFDCFKAKKQSKAVIFLYQNSLQRERKGKENHLKEFGEEKAVKSLKYFQNILDVQNRLINVVLMDETIYLFPNAKLEPCFLIGTKMQ